MYIKALTIHGFKSFRDTVGVADFSSQNNVIVGRNGAGKSNFFSAIRFVLSDAYTLLSREERHALLYDASGATSTTLSAYVEIVFDNSDARFPLSGDEVVLRRAISLGKDEYWIDKKSASKAEVDNLLESAGFSRSNPYYIVPQGRITHLTNMSDAERLALLKDVAGTRVYEQRRTDSVDIIRATDARYSGTAELLRDIEQRIEELGKEQGELRKFHARDRERRGLEYTIYQRELADCAELLDALEAERRTDVDTWNAQRAELTEQDHAVAHLEEQLVAARVELEQLALDQAQLDQERRTLGRHRAELESTLEDLGEARDASARTQLETQLRTLTDQIAAKDETLAEQTQAQRRAAQALEQKRGELEQIRSRIAALYAKQGRAAHFASAEERDAAVQSELAALDADAALLASASAAADKSCAEEDAQLQALAAQRTQLEASLASRSDALTRLGDAWRAQNEQRDALVEQKKELWKQETKINATLAHARDQHSAAQRTLAATMDRATASGLASIEAIAAREQMHGVYGPLYQLFSVDDRYKAAVEATAGASLFYVVVDTDATASTLLEHLHKENSGRVTFMPLNRLHPPDVAYPQSNDVIVLLRKLTFDPKYMPALKQVFGKTILCPKLDVAAAHVRSAHGQLNAITLDGDQVDRRGTLSGGFHDPRRSRLDAVRNAQRWLDEVRTGTVALDSTRAQLGEMEQQITQLYSDMHKLETQRQQLQDARTPDLETLAWVRRQEADAKARIARLEHLGAERAIEIASLQTRRVALEAELGTPLVDALRSDEVQALAQLVAQEGAVQKEVAAHTRAAHELANATSALSMELEEGLLREQGDVAGRLESMDTPLHPRGSEEAAASLQRHLDTNAARIGEIQQRYDALATQVQAYEDELEAQHGKQTEHGGEVQRQQKLAERFSAKKQRLLEQRDRVNQQIRDLGALPEDVFDKYTKLSTEQLVEQLQKARNALDQVAHVNKRAVEQYNSFSKQRDTLLQRHAELEKSHGAIDELVEVLDSRKDAALLDTYTQVSDHFARIFAQLVPGGKGRLEMVRDERGVPAGVEIHVAFSSAQQGQRVQQLSGGQKSLVALATVFSIQKTDPAPFYLFDEIDANLDTQYRTAVATMIAQLATDAQFICTTFRPELVERADRFFGIVFGTQKVSSVVEIAKAQALEFVDAAEGQ
ncbi:Smc3p [Malassezia vespertilionis]|uniref:Structural maintenance of chromosomes protein n=2 Tax=Malassezia vespertilionis TaxID=2020962 RepID=A0A2N1JG06_9BASI|nr:Smc3p [Malassezia vespertilionis]